MNTKAVPLSDAAGKIYLKRLKFFHKKNQDPKGSSFLYLLYVTLNTVKLLAVENLRNT